MTYAIAFLLGLLFWQTDGSTKDPDQVRHEAVEAAKYHHEEAVRLNDLAGHIRTESDADNLIDSIAKMFADELPPPWATREVRRRLARAEYAALTNPAHLIPEERLAGIWNEYARAIGADEETIVSTAEVRSLRDLQYASADLYWSEGWMQTIWTMPNVFTLGPDGKVANRCRPLEAMRVFYDLDHQFRNLRAARKALETGKSFSDETQRLKHRDRSLDRAEVRVELTTEVEQNPIRAAEYRFITEHGRAAMYSLLKRLTDEFLTE